ncbi:MAG TPA: response regulator transcription factor [Acidimicrobiales bacterium]|nr:response regulator transcription factor [Acidimicrobiales bacterium]
MTGGHGAPGGSGAIPSHGAAAAPDGPADAPPDEQPDPASDQPADAPLRVVITDDHPVVRQGLRSFLEARGVEVVGEAGDGDEAVRLVREARPDVLLTDLVMPGVDGIEAIRRLRAADDRVGILVLTSFGGADQVIPAIRAGADGYLLKDAGPAALEDALRAVHRGEPMLGPEAAAVVMARVAAGDEAAASPPAVDDPDLARLTRREREVLAGLGRGLSNRALADELFVSEKTIKTHVSSVLAKLRLPDRTRAALFAVRSGLVDPRA